MKRKKVDSILIGINDLDFQWFIETIGKMGKDSGAYRDLNKSFITYEGQHYHLPSAYNLLNSKNIEDKKETAISLDETFNAAIAYLGTYLDRRGFTFDFVNTFQEHKDYLREQLETCEIETAVITTTLYVMAFPILEIIKFIRKYSPKTKILLGGPYVSTQCRTLEQKELVSLFETLGADIYVNSSQGESTLVNILKAIKNEESLHLVKNIAFKEKDKFIITEIETESNKLPENMVNWSLFSDRVGKYVNIRTAISCPFKCEFCSFPEHAGKYQTSEICAIEQELDLLKKIPSVQSLYIIDDTVNIPVQRFKELMRTMIKKEYNFSWYCNFRCQFADRETVELMKLSGCVGVFLGIESGNNQILKNMNKTATVEKYIKGVELLKEFGIVMHGGLIVGFPGETYETAMDSFNFIEDSGIDFFRAQVWYCEPITPIYKKKEMYGIEGIAYDWKHNTMDATTASNIVDEMFLNAKKTIWTPQYNFDMDHIFHFMHRGIPMDNIKNIMSTFNNAIKEKLINPAVKEISMESFMQLKESILWNEINHSKQNNIDSVETLIEFDL